MSRRVRQCSIPPSVTPFVQMDIDGRGIDGGSAGEGPAHIIASQVAWQRACRGEGTVRVCGEIVKSTRNGARARVRQTLPPLPPLVSNRCGRDAPKWRLLAGLGTLGRDETGVVTDADHAHARLVNGTNVCGGDARRRPGTTRGCMAMCHVQRGGGKKVCGGGAGWGGGRGCIGRGEGNTPPPLQGPLPMPSHYPPDGKCQARWHL